jgi:hypothetical protein
MPLRKPEWLFLFIFIQQSKGTMKKRLPAFIALVLSLLLIIWLPQQHFSARPLSRQSLFQSPDDPDGANTYDFYRLRNPSTGLVPFNMRQKELTFAKSLPKYNDLLRGVTTTWQNRGPYNLGGRTRAITLDITNENTILAGQVTGGMWRSDNGGASFTQTTQPEQLHSTTCIVQDVRAGHTNVWYYGTGEQYAVVNAAGFSSQFAGDGIFKSTDGGHTWAQLPSTMDTTYPKPFYGKRNFDFVWQMVTDPTDTLNDIVYAAVVNGIWRSADGGTTWTPVLGLDTASALNVSYYSDIAITSTGVLYATISSETPSGGIYRSTDGISWQKITPAAFPSDFERIEVGIAPSDESQLYILAQTPGTGNTGHSLWHYHNIPGDTSAAGGKWTDLTSNVPDDHCIWAADQDYDFKEYTSQQSYDMFIAVYPTDTNIVFIGGTDLYYSTTGFTTYGYNWIGGYQCDTADYINYLYPNHHPDQHRLIFLPSNNQVAISASDGGIRETNNILADTVQWQSLNNGYNTGQFYTCAVEPGNATSQMIIGGLQDNGSYFTNTIDYTQPWGIKFLGDGGYCAITHGRNTYYMSVEDGKTYKLSISDSGVVSGYTRIDPSGGYQYLFISPFILDPTNDSIMYFVVGKEIWRNDSLPVIPITGNVDNPITQGWVRLTGTSTGNGLSSPNISALSISEADPNILYFGTDQGQVWRVDSCRYINNSPKINITDSIFPAGAYVSSIQADRLNPSNVMVTFSNYGVKSIFYSNNGGTTWTDVAGNLEEYPDGSGNGPSVAWGHIYNNGTTSKYYAGTSVGLYSTDSLNGLYTIWTQEGLNTIGNVVVDMITSRIYDSLVVVATHGNGIYTNQVFIPTAINEIQTMALKLSCYPNPFNSSIIIEASGTTSGQMEADIYDISGRCIKKIKQANTSRLIWDGSSTGNNYCAAGTYIIRVTLNEKSGFIKAVKM